MQPVFARCPALHRFTVRDRSGLPDTVDPTALEGELFIFEIALSPRLGGRQYDDVYREIAATIAAVVLAIPGAKQVLAGRSFVRALH
ncbi:MAG TPA: hypothetical protein VFC18_00925 [Burkholderiales bacterium]|nr:hypothetical protein [Burkholderiales bacterium]